MQTHSGAAPCPAIGEGVIQISSVAVHQLRQLDIAPEQYVQYLELLGARHAQARPLDATQVRDLVLACGCYHANVEALRQFHDACSPIWAALCAKLRLSPQEQLDPRQRLWCHLFVGGPKEPKILSYGGQGPLTHWFRVTAARFLFNELRSRKRDRLVFASQHEVMDLPTQGDPELALLEATHRKSFRTALVQAVASLTPEERNALRCHYLLSMSIDQMAAALGVHRATAARRIMRAREVLLSRTVANLRESEDLDTEQLQSLLKGVCSASSWSVARLLAPI